jgi:OMF family outer membrane factor
MKLVNIHTLAFVFAFAWTVTESTAQVWTLQQCLDMAQVRNKSLHISDNNIALGGQRHLEAKANRLPKVTAQADYKYFTNLPYQLLPLSAFNPSAPEGEFKAAQFGVPHSINANLQLILPIYNPQVNGAIQTTQIATEISVLKQQKTEEEVYFEVSNLYYNAQILHHQQIFIDSNLANAHRLLTNIQLLHEQLMATENDVNKIKLQVAQLAVQKENIQSQYQQVLNGLRFMIGLPIEDPLEIDPEIIYRERSDGPSSLTLDLQIIRTQNSLLQHELQTLNMSRLMPSLGLFATYGTTGFGYDKEPGSFLDFYPIGFTGLQVSYTLFNGMVTQRKINQKKLELRNNDLQYNQLLEQTSMQTKNAYLKINVAKSTIETSRKQIELAMSVYEQTVLQQKQGMGKLTDVLQADNALREAQQTYLSAIINYLKADLEVKKLTNQLRITN